VRHLAHSSPISGIDVSDVWVATAGYDNRVILWDKRRRVAHAVLYHDHLANSCLFLSAGKLLASCGSDYTVRFWSTVGEPWLRAVYSGHDDDVEMIADNPSRGLIATASRDASVHIVNYEGVCQAKLRGHTQDVNAVFWLGQEQVLSASNDGTVRIWNARDGSTERIIDLGEEDCDCVIASPSGHIFAGNDSGDLVRLGEDGQERQPCHAAGVKRLAMSRDGSMLASLSYDQTLIVWQVGADGSLTKLRKATYPAVVWARACAFHDERTLAFGSFGSSYALYDFHAERWDLSTIEPTWGVNAVAVAGDRILAVGDAGFVSLQGRVVASVGSLCNFIGSLGDEKLAGGQLGRVFRIVDGSIVYQHQSPLNCCCAFALDGQELLAIGTYSGEVVLLEQGSQGISVRNVVRVHKNAIKDVCLAGHSLVTVSADAAVAIVDPVQGIVSNLVRSAHQKITNGCVGLSQETCRFATVGRDRILKLWEGTEAEEVATPHTHSVRAVSYSPVSQAIATGSYSGDLWIYDVAQKVGIAFTRLTTSGISSLSWRQADDVFVAGSYDGSVYIVGARTGSLLDQFRAFGS
jgi:WD40 repeat protein